MTTLTKVMEFVAIGSFVLFLVIYGAVGVFYALAALLLRLIYG